MWVNLRIRIRAAVFVWHWASAYSPGPVTILEQTQSLTHYGVQGRVLIANPPMATVHGLIKGTPLAFRCTSLPADATAIIRNTRLVLPILPILHINIMITMSNPRRNISPWATTLRKPPNYAQKDVVLKGTPVLALTD